MKKIILSSIFASMTFALHAQEIPIYANENFPTEERIEDALQRMTLEEKITILHAQSIFSSAGVKRLGIPEVWMSDGPHGVRAENSWDKWTAAGWSNDSCVAFPALTCLAATWNTELSHLYGKSIGEEARYRKKTVLLGPGINIYRTPLNGRNFEYLGEDPYLTSQMVVPYVKGVQENGVAACVKHYALNNQEVNRHTGNAVVDDRALHEIYLPGFKAAVLKGKAWAIMGSYNLYKGQHACHNQYLLKDILKRDWKFDGVVISDWGGTHDTDQAITNGLDMEFGTWTNGLSEGTKNAYDNYHLAYPYLRKIQKGEIGTKELNEKVRRVLRLIYRTELNRNRPWGSMNSEAHYAAARSIGSEGIVLLKNENNVLPINLNKGKRIAVIGENAVKLLTLGGGSSTLKVQREISPLEGILKRVGDQGTVTWARGYVGDYVGDSEDAYSEILSKDKWNDKRSAKELTAEAVKRAKEADYVLYIGGLNKHSHQDCEDSDRKSLHLSYGQDELINELAKVNKNLIVVNLSGNAIAMPWIKKVPAIVQGWYIGSEAGHALADVLFGDINPSGKLPFTFPVKLEDNGAHALGEYVGETSKEVIDIHYNEGLFVGYRWTDKQKIKPLFAFGHGLSYTTFKYGKATADKKQLKDNEVLTIKVPITNIGERTGKEIVQLYIHDVKSSLVRPMKELKGFQKIELQPGETKEVTFQVNRDALSYYDDKQQAWIAEPGKFEALIAASAVDIRSKIKFELQ